MIRRAGDTALLIDLADLEEVHRFDAAVRVAQEEGRAPFTELIDVLPAASTLMVTTAPGGDLAALEKALAELDVDALAAREDDSTETSVEIEVVYDGPDLDEVAELTGLSTREVIEAHTATPWRAAFGGFAPGFFYLVDGDPRLEVPRRSEPRTAVPPGSVALAGTMSAVYPRQSPGGWQLIGRTEQTMWDTSATPPALLAPGTVVTFVEAGS
ncbi:MAG: allophanate hydrolase subunit 1 [Mobilicoccus sp.]|nr:allophanate hydrolase subunit 1 [Mobilicoccus sp.]